MHHNLDAPAASRSSAPTFDVARLLDEHEGQTLSLHERHINPSFAAVLKTIGFDINITRGEGAHLFDDRGNRYIDCLGGYAVFNCGRNHPVIRDALRQAMDLDLPNLPGIGGFRTAPLLAKALLEVAPSAPRDDPLDTVFFASSGGEAMDAAIKHARIATGRVPILYWGSDAQWNENSR